MRVLFDNLYIEAEYLRMLIKKNLDFLEHHSDKDSEEPDVIGFKDREMLKLKNFLQTLGYLKR